VRLLSLHRILQARSLFDAVSQNAWVTFIVPRWDLLGSSVRSFLSKSLIQHRGLIWIISPTERVRLRTRSWSPASRMSPGAWNLLGSTGHLI